MARSLSTIVQSRYEKSSQERLQDGQISELLLVTWNTPASLGNELGGALVDIWAGGGDLVLLFTISAE